MELEDPYLFNFLAALALSTHPPAPNATLALRSNLWVPLGFCGRLRVVWKELQMAWPWHRDEAR